MASSAAVAAALLKMFGLLQLLSPERMEFSSTPATCSSVDKQFLCYFLIVDFTFPHSSDRTRTSIVNGLRKKLSDSMNSFNDLRNKMASKYHETVQRRYYTVTCENPDESTVDNLISTGQSKTFLQKAIQEQGRGQVMDTILEIKELLIQKRVPCLLIF
ncbi:hypothetical protein L2E82_02643 [Cichorium intybus]|uniref:Uncharacterized protein n=1 Tax=Cichorium intybus TaxID=13427 RepID=A0ACB9H276_CICIN|nr:hypothetical protein L2E82_02643 [Cichorium intybus]